VLKQIVDFVAMLVVVSVYKAKTRGNIDVLRSITAEKIIAGSLHLS
jgi:hypothetical protein